MINRREFLRTATGATVVAGSLHLLDDRAHGQEKTQDAKIPAVISTWNFGKKANQAAAKVLQAGGTALDAVEQGINDAELDPENTSVGYGGLPNEEGEVELDAVIMDGITHRAGAVGELHSIKTPISVARRVMEKTKHTFLVGEGALAFAEKMGFKKEDLLTEKAKKLWEDWKKNPKKKDFWSHDTLGMVAIDSKGAVAAGCSTSGLAFKIRGRVGDSPIVGAGAYCDNDIGGAAATGNGDWMMRFCLSYQVVEGMRNGLSPRDACRATLKRMSDKKIKTDACVIALNKKGEFGAATLSRPFEHAVWNSQTDEIRTAQ